jgi:hypothetical protein
VVESVFELIIVVVAKTPLIVLLKTLAAEVKVLVVEEAIKEAKFVVVETPFTVEVKFDPLIVKPLLLIILLVAIDPPKLEVKVLPVAFKLLLVDKLVTERLVVVALVAVKLVKAAVTALSKVVKRLVLVALVTVKLSAVVLPVSMRLLS